MRKVKDITNEVLALTPVQKEAFKDLAKAILRCKELGMAIIRTGTGTFAVNDEHIYDVNPTYDDWSVECTNLMNQDILPHIKCYDVSQLLGDNVRIAYDEETAGQIYKVLNNIKA